MPVFSRACVGLRKSKQLNKLGGAYIAVNPLPSLRVSDYPASLALALLALLVLSGCATPQPGSDAKTGAPVDAGLQTSQFDPLEHCKALAYTQQEACIQQVAVQGHYPALCDQLDAKARAKCLLDIALDARDPTTCQGIKNGPTMDSCFKTVALLTKKFAPCASMSSLSAQDVFSKNDCYVGVARSTQDAAGCAYITNEVTDQDGFHYHRDQCYWQVFDQTHDQSLCVKFLDPVKAAACAEQAGKPGASQA